MREIVREIVRKITVVSVAALMLAALAIPKMASAQAPEVWYIKATIMLASGGTRDTQFMVPDEDQGGRPSLVTFRSKDQCEGARANDPNVAGPLAMYAHIVASRGDSIVVACVPLKSKGEDI